LGRFQVWLGSVAILTALFLVIITGIPTDASSSQALPIIHYVAGSPVAFATHSELSSYGFSFGPSDGTFGAVSAGGGNYIFYGSAGSTSSCAGTPNVKEGEFAFTGTLDHVTGSNGCMSLFSPGDGPSGWVFDANYAGGGQVVPFASGGKNGWLIPFHAEVWWQNPATPDHKCIVGAGHSEVNCFYGSLGLVISTDNGRTFKVVGQILQPSQSISVFKGGGKNMNVGYGSLIIADANGNHLNNPPPDPSNAYFYLFYADLLPGLPGACATSVCMGVARAPYADVVAAALSGDGHKVAEVFHKYDGASPNPWTQPATGDTPDLSGTAGRYAPLWTDEPAIQPEVMYDSSFNLYLVVYQSGGGFKLRASSDLIHWSEPIGTPYYETGRMLYYPTLIGETGDPTLAGSQPRIYFTSFPNGAFPNYATSVFESVQLTLSAQTPSSTTSENTGSASTTSSAMASSTSSSAMSSSQYPSQAGIDLLVATVVAVVLLGGVFALRRHGKPQPQG